MKSSEVNEDYIYVPEDTYVEEYTRVMSDGAVRLGWFQVGEHLETALRQLW